MYFHPSLPFAKLELIIKLLKLVTAVTSTFSTLEVIPDKLVSILETLEFVLDISVLLAFAVALAVFAVF